MVTPYLITDGAQGKIPLRQVLWVCCGLAARNYTISTQSLKLNSTNLQSLQRDNKWKKVTPTPNTTLQIKQYSILRQYVLSQI